MQKTKLNSDTKNLLKQLNSGCKTATNSIGQMLPYVKDQSLTDTLMGYNDRFIRIGDRCHQLLNETGRDEEDPSAMSKAMVWMTTAVKMNLNDDPCNAAKIMADGCKMGIETVRKALRDLRDAAPEAKNLAEELIDAQQQMQRAMQDFCMAQE